MDIPDEYASRIRVLSNGCWNWTGAIVGLHNQAGSLPYGVLLRSNKRIRAHRYFYELATGIEPGRNHVHHKCENTLCVNPDHLELLTQAEHNRHHGKLGDHLNAARSREYCLQGHLWSENAYIWNGIRYCRACTTEAQRRRRKARGEGLKGQGHNMRVKTHCPQGHPYEGENLLVDKRGGRNCRICLAVFSNERKRRYRERLKAKQQETAP